MGPVQPHDNRSQYAHIIAETCDFRQDSLDLARKEIEVGISQIAPDDWSVRKHR